MVVNMMRNATKRPLTSLTLFRVNDVQSQRNIFATIHLRKIITKRKYDGFEFH